MYNEKQIETLSLFNSPLEVALRLLVLLSKTTSDKLEFDLERLIIFDYFILHANDLDGNFKSLHPPLPHRSSEIIIKRKLINEGIDILTSRGLVSHVLKEEGIFYSANTSALFFIRLLKSKYYINLSSAIEFILFNYGNVHTKELNNIINKNIHIWGGEFEYEALVRSNYEK